MCRQMHAVVVALVGALANCTLSVLVTCSARSLLDPCMEEARCRPGCIVTGGVDMPTRRMNIGAMSAPRSIASIVMDSLESGFDTSVQRELDC